jgi:molybdopterin synthase sulfur carrier subunit
MTLRIKYFAWVRERVGKPEEDIELPGAVATVADLVGFLKARGEEYAHAFEHEHVVRAAVDQRHAPATTDIRFAREVAFFPPMTGG